MRRSNPASWIAPLDFVELAMTNEECLGKERSAQRCPMGGGGDFPGNNVPRGSLYSGMKPTAHVSEDHATRLFVAMLAGAGLALLAGCGSETVAPVPPPVTPPTQTVVVAPAVTPAPQTAVIGATSTGQIVVTQAPPVSMQQQVIGARPSAEHVWVEGWWVWRDGRYEWRPGEWVIPPRRGAVWVAPRWERRDDGYVFVEGYWQ